MGVLSVIIISNEYTYKTLRQHVIDGLSIKKAILGKFLVLLSFSIIITLYTFLTGLLFGLANTTTESTFMSGIDSIGLDRKSTRLNSSHVRISYAVFCLKKK